MSENIDKIPVGVSANIFSTFHLHNLNLVDALAELIDNSIGGHDKLKSDSIAEIDLLLEEDSLVIIDFGNGLSRRDFNTALITYDQNDNRLKDATFNTYGYGLKGSAFWIGNHLQIESCSYEDDMFYKCIMDITKISPELQPTPTVNLIASKIPDNIDVYYTKITISNINAHNYDISDVAMNKIHICLGRIYHPLIRLGKLAIRVNGQLINPEERVYLRSFPFSCYTKISSKEYYINEKAENYNIQEWKFPVNTTKIYNNICYEVTGFIGMSNNNQEGNKGIRVYRKNRGLLGCNTLFNQFNPLNLQSRSSEDLFHIGELHISNSFTKPPIGGNNALLEIEILNEMIMEAYQSEPLAGFKSQLKNFKVHMCKAGYNNPPKPVSVAPVSPITPKQTDSTKTNNTTSSNGALRIDPQKPREIIPSSREWRIDDKTYKVNFTLDKDLPQSRFNWLSTDRDLNTIFIDIQVKNEIEILKMLVKLLDKHYLLHNQDSQNYSVLINQLLN